MKIFRSRESTAVLFSAGLILLLAAGCSRDNSDSNSSLTPVQDDQKLNSIILRIEESYYFNSDFEDYVRRGIGDIGDTLSVSTLSRLYDRFVDEKIFLEKAREQEVTLTEEEKKKYLAQLQDEAVVDQRGSMTDSDLQSLYDKLLTEKYIFLIVKDITVDESELSEYYELHKGDFLQPERVQVSQILLDTEEKAIEVLKSVQYSSEEEFRLVAGEESSGPEASKGGKMGVFSPGQLPFEIEKVVFSLREGEISPIVESSYGYHIFRMDKKYEPQLISKEEAASKIKVKILDQKIKQEIAKNLEELKRSLDWESFSQNLFFTYQRNGS